MRWERLRCLRSRLILAGSVDQPVCLAWCLCRLILRALGGMRLLRLGISPALSAETGMAAVTVLAGADDAVRYPVVGVLAAARVGHYRDRLVTRHVSP